MKKTNNQPEVHYDAFISHASEDKRYFVRVLAKRLVDYGASIWYDEFSLKAGSSLSRSIEKGLTHSEHGIVVLSTSFFNKRWSEYELRALNSYEIEKPGTIIPIWYKVDQSQVRDFSPYLADKFAIVHTSTTSINEIAVKILEIVRQDIFRQIHIKQAWQEIIDNAAQKKVHTKDIKYGPIRHKKFPKTWINRIRLIRSALFEAHPHSMAFWLEGFQRDVHPEKEIEVWEKVVTTFLESTIKLKLNNRVLKKDTLSLILQAVSGASYSELQIGCLTTEHVNTILKILVSTFPPYDIKDKQFGT